MADAMHRVDGDLDLFHRLLSSFGATQADVAGAIAAALDEQRLSDARKLAHDLKSMAGNLGAKRLAVVADQTQIAAGRGNHAAAQSHLPELKRELDAVLETARNAARDAAPAAWDGAPLAESLGRLARLLDENDFAATREWARLAGPLGAHLGRDSIHTVTEAIAFLDFTRAHDLVRRLAHELHVHLPTG